MQASKTHIINREEIGSADVPPSRVRVSASLGLAQWELCATV